MQDAALVAPNNTTNTIDPFNSFSLCSSDNPGTLMMSIKLEGKINFLIFEGSMRRAFNSKDPTEAFQKFILHSPP